MTRILNSISEPKTEGLAKPPKAPQIVDAIMQCTQENRELIESISQLEERLRPILEPERPSQPGVETPPNTQVSTALRLSEQIRANTVIVRIAREMLSSILQRLEI